MDTLPPGPDPTPAQCKCTVCQQTFAGISLFDRHRRAGRCIDPRTVTGWRLVRGVWRGPTSDHWKAHTT